jgi:hypothetical protein
MKPYPSHLVRYPERLAGALVPSKRHNGPGLFASVRHPLAALVVFAILLAWACIPIAWFLAVTAGWALWVLAVTIGWACTAPFGSRK